MAAVQIGFGETELVLRRILDVPESGLATFRSRIKYLRKLGFPPGLNTGKGTRAVYGGSELLQLGLALTLQQVGLTAEGAVTLMADREGDIAAAALAVAEGGTGAAASYLMLDPVPDSKGVIPLWMGDQRFISDALRETQGRGGLVRLCIINLTSVIQGIIRWLVDIFLYGPREHLIALSQRPAEFISDIRDWSERSAGHVD